MSSGVRLPAQPQRLATGPLDPLVPPAPQSNVVNRDAARRAPSAGTGR